MAIKDMEDATCTDCYFIWTKEKMVTLERNWTVKVLGAIIMKEKEQRWGETGHL